MVEVLDAGAAEADVVPGPTGAERVACEHVRYRRMTTTRTCRDVTLLPLVVHQPKEA
jgi:hypothetical protein